MIEKPRSTIWHDPYWMPYMVLTRAEIIGTNPISMDRIKGNLDFSPIRRPKSSFTNLITALLIGYKDLSHLGLDIPKYTLFPHHVGVVSEPARASRRTQDLKLSDMGVIIQPNRPDWYEQAEKKMTLK